MEAVFVFLFLASLLALIVGLIKPGLVIRWGTEPTRRKVLLTYGFATIASFILIGLFAPDVPPEARTALAEAEEEDESEQAEENQVNRSGNTAPGSPDLATGRERANSDDAQSANEAFAHAEARASVIMNVQPNKLKVGGREFRVKRNPVGKGSFVYDPRTRFSGVERFLVWWVPEEGKVYPLNSPSKMVTSELPWPREDGIDAPSTAAVIDYVFRGKSMTSSEKRNPEVTSQLPPLSDGVMVEIEIDFSQAKRPVLTGKTNLPDGTELMTSVQGETSDFFGQDRAAVENGSFRAGPFGPTSGLVNGKYVAGVGMPLPRLQSESVKSVIGENGENLKGPIVRRGALGLGATVSVDKEFQIGDEAQIEEAREDQQQAYE